MKKQMAAFLFVPLFFNAASVTYANTQYVQKAPKSHGVFYEVYVNSFYDSNSDGHGDLKGLIEKLDYLNDGKSGTKSDLGIAGLWLMPINTSPSYHKYDVIDYYNVDPTYGSVEDFRKLTQEAHKRGIKVTMDLVINHTSVEHPWFAEASKDKTSNFRDYYVWADENTDLNEKGSWGQQLWYKNPNGDGYFYSTFWEGMPDLNFDNPEVRKEAINIGKFWIKQGADGFRLDAAMHIYPGQKAEGAKKNYEWWQTFQSEMKKVHPNVILTGEVWNELDVIAPYYQSLHSNFNFPLADLIMQTVRNGSDQGIVSLSRKSQEAFAPYNKGYVDSPFLTNHDMNRVMSVLGGDLNKAKVAASILLTLPGNPYIYYGEEIGMRGEKPDEYIREPFRWYKQAGKGQTTWEQPVYNTGRNGASVEEQTNKKDSLLSHYRNLIQARQNNKALAYGDISEVDLNNKQVVAFKRTYGKDVTLVLHNISAKAVTIDVGNLVKKNVKITFSTDKQIKYKKKLVTLPPYATVILQ